MKHEIEKVNAVCVSETVSRRVRVCGIFVLGEIYPIIIFEGRKWQMENVIVIGINRKTGEAKCKTDWKCIYGLEIADICDGFLVKCFNI